MTPFLLQPDNFTPPTRTPWGGTFIRKLKRTLLPSTSTNDPAVVGESWEFSLGPEFESKTVEGASVAQLIQADTHAWLGESADQKRLVVKIIDARSALSLQLHPPDSDSQLAAAEAGKTEAWYVVSAEKDAGVFLGFKFGTAQAQIASVLASGASLEPFLRFVPAQVGDVFLVEPGMPHAIGAGLVLIEPQVVAAQKRGLTYRYWDWNRRYDAEGNLSNAGQPRELHAARALELTAWTQATNDQHLQKIHHRFGDVDVQGAPVIERLCGNFGPVFSKSLELIRFSGSGETVLPAIARLRVLTVIQGEITLFANQKKIRVPQGQSLVIPAALREVEVQLASAHATLSSA